MNNETIELKKEIERLNLIINLLVEKLRIINTYIAKDIIMDSDGNIQIMASSTPNDGESVNGNSIVTLHVGENLNGNSNKTLHVGEKVNGKSANIHHIAL